MRRKKKLSERLSDALLARIVDEKMQPGDRLPKEHELVEEFGCSKGSLREALKSLENQGIVTISTGPNGGARLIDVTYEYANKALRNYFRFKDTSPTIIYDVREPLELALCHSVVGHLSPHTLSELEVVLTSLHSFLDLPETNIEVWQMRRESELQFNNIIAEASPNPLLSFLCLFINDLIGDAVVDNYVFFDGRPELEFGRTLYRHIESYYKCLVAEDKAGALKAVAARTSFVRSTLEKIVPHQAEANTP